MPWYVGVAYLHVVFLSRKLIDALRVARTDESPAC